MNLTSRLEDGFELEMKEIISQLPHINKRILTSATQSINIPGFVRLDQPTIVNYLKVKVVSKLEIKTVVFPSKNKSQTLLRFNRASWQSNRNYIL